MNSTRDSSQSHPGILKLARRIWILSALLICFIGPAVRLNATVNVVSYWHLGENDPGAADSVTATNTIDSAGTNNLTVQGPATYANDVAALAANRTGSSLSINFANPAYATCGIVSTNVDNFGIECWVKPTMTSSNQVIAYNGATGGAGDGGWGFIISSTNTYAVLFGGLSVFGGTNLATANTWTHLALVRDSGTNTLYVNGAAAATSLTKPGAPGGNFALGAPPQSPTAQFFTGLLDEVRVFTFTAGQFSTNDLLLNQNLGPLLGAVAAANITATNATLEAYVNPNGSPATAWFSYGTSQVYSATNVVPNVGNGVSPVLVTANISGLTAGTVYHFQVSTTNSFGFATSSDQAFEALNPPFTETTISVPGGAPNASGDFDDDGQLDILFQNGFADTEVWRNTGDGFSDLAGGLPVIRGGSVALGDFDNDGRLDIVLTTHTNNNDGFSETYLTQIWRNTGNGFSNINSALPAVYDSSIAVGDFDNDGRQDILIAGYDEFGNPLTQLWRNTGNGFTNINAGLPGVGACSVAWGDFDNDGRPDILLSGYTGNQGGINFALFITQVWRNTGNGFTNINAGLPGVFDCSVAWGDFDNDGRLDILLSGIDTNGTAITQVWRNTGSGFTNINAGLPGVYFGTAEWGDFDNDGRLDILISGTEQDGTPITQLWRNTGNGFVKAMDVAAFGTASVPLGDYNQDGRLDLFLGSQLWVNQALFTNTPPSAPTGLSAAISGSQLTLSWNASSDLQTPAAGLSYNVRVGTTPGGSDIVNPMALTNGTRLIASRGSIQTTNFTVQLPFTPVPGTLLFWSVQSIDTGFEGSPFAPEATFQVRPAFTGWGRLSDGAFEGQFYALAGTNYFIQASTDLVHWQDLLDFNFDNGGPIMFTDPNATNYPRRFYRFGQH